MIYFKRKKTDEDGTPELTAEEQGLIQSLDPEQRPKVPLGVQEKNQLAGDYYARHSRDAR